MDRKVKEALGWPGADGPFFIRDTVPPKNERTYFHVFPGRYFDDVFFIIYRFPTVCHFFVAFSQIKSSYPVVRGSQGVTVVHSPLAMGSPGAKN